MTSTSHATSPPVSRRSTSSSTPSEIWSATLSGWPSVTDSDVNRNSRGPAVDIRRMVVETLVPASAPWQSPSPIGRCAARAFRTPTCPRRGGSTPENSSPGRATPGHDSYSALPPRPLLRAPAAAGPATLDLGCGEGRVARDLTALRPRRRRRGCCARDGRSRPRCGCKLRCAARRRCRAAVRGRRVRPRRGVHVAPGHRRHGGGRAGERTRPRARRSAVPRDRASHQLGRLVRRGRPGQPVRWSRVRTSTAPPTPTSSDEAGSTSRS